MESLSYCGFGVSISGEVSDGFVDTAEPMSHFRLGMASPLLSCRCPELDEFRRWGTKCQANNPISEILPILSYRTLDAVRFARIGFASSSHAARFWNNSDGFDGFLDDSKSVEALHRDLVV